MSTVSQRAQDADILPEDEQSEKGSLRTDVEIDPVSVEYRGALALNMGGTQPNQPTVRPIEPGETRLSVDPPEQMPDSSSSNELASAPVPGSDRENQQNPPGVGFALGVLLVILGLSFANRRSRDTF